MKLTVELLREIVEDLKCHVLNNRLATITVINSTDFLFSFSVYRKEKLFISLNHNLPFISLIDHKDSLSTTGDKTSQILRKELKDAYITNIEIMNNDRILKMSLLKSNDFYEKEKRSLILELIPHRANMILLDQNDVIIFALHQNGLDTNHPTLKGLVYSYLSAKDLKPLTSDTSIKELKEYANEYIYNAKSGRLKEKYLLLFKHIKSKINSLEKKLITLDIESQRANNNLVYKDHGDMVIALANTDKESLTDYLINNDIKDEYNDSFSFGINANNFYKKYKKAKRTLEMNKIEKEKSFDALAYYRNIQNQIAYMNDDDLYELALEVMPHKFKKNNDKKSFSSKLSYIEVNNKRIYFGKNAKQNELITFKLSKKEYWYFHIKDYHGSHVIIFDDNPNNELRLIASEMCLLLANQNDGEIYCTQIKNIKKGNAPGLALLNSQQSIVLKSVRESTKELLRDYKN